MTPYRVQFVCLGNICRSPMAESVLRRQGEQAGLGRALSVDSAGTGGWHVGDPADRRARAVLLDHGYDADHTAKQFQPTMFADRDLVVALDSDNLRDLRRLAPDKATSGSVRLLREFDLDADSLDVPDPYYGGREGFVEVLRTIESACVGLLDHLRASTRAH
ncbi:MAG: low molecular weight protein-tyrosine-phosphatase [Actinomycetes bacterium]